MIVKQRAAYISLAGALIVTLISWFAFTLPDHPDAIGFDAFARLPLEWPLLMLLLILVPTALRRPLVGGLLLLLILFLKMADIGTKSAFQRPFNPYLDAKMLADGWNLMSGTVGAFAAMASVAVAILALFLILIVFLKSARWMAEMPSPARSLDDPYATGRVAPRRVGCSAWCAEGRG